jgi:starch synthase (maltosyl-transferring)
MINDSRTFFAPKIYYFHPPQAGPHANWPHHLRRIRDMGFDHVLTAPVFAPGGHGDVFLTGDHNLAYAAFEKIANADAAVAQVARAARNEGLSLLIDIVVGQAASDAVLVHSHPHWFYNGYTSSLRIDPRSSPRQIHAARFRFDDPAASKEIVAWWIARLTRLANAGVEGFRCIEPHQVPPQIWRDIIDAVSQSSPQCRFLAWTPGVSWDDLRQLRGVGFAAAFSSLPWWDGRADWLFEEHDLLRGIGAVIACPEAPFGPRLARRSPDVADLPLIYRRQSRLAAAIGNGIMIPMGFEFAASEDLNPRLTANHPLIGVNGSNIDFSAEIREATFISDSLAPLGVGELRSLAEANGPVTMLLRRNGSEIPGALAPVVVVTNTDLHHDRPLPINLNPLPPSAGASLAVSDVIAADSEAPDRTDAGEVRILQMKKVPLAPWYNTNADPSALATAARIIIDNVNPRVDGGRFAAKRVIGEAIAVSADVFTDGHDVLVVELLWRSLQDQSWQRLPMQSLGNDRWQTSITPDRIGRYEFTVEAWTDKYASLCRDIEIKVGAGTDVDIETAEARDFLQSTAQRTNDGAKSVISSSLDWLRDSPAQTRAEILLTPDLREVMRESEERQFATLYAPTFLVDVERPQADFSSWYELFPRSVTSDPSRHGTFADVIRRLPAIKDMGFDVLYMPPIHPIGITNRKGKNNALQASPSDVGSPYAIGGIEGGHTAVHPALGTIEDFRRLHDAAQDLGMELALDFAIQCSPDHPWLREHPEWFSWRPDGSVKFAENPPKKYEDIVNVDFYANGAVSRLWTALRDIVLFWVNEGVRIFRVDNPHTKPLPFWEWMIASVRSQHPDVIFLAEAFTKPKMMYRLAKVGFSQSYTYFTWRHSKQELVDYFVELTMAPAKEFFRPHLFVNTPDINPYFLQTSGRPGFLIRAALAATLSGLWGMYSGFEVCEAEPLARREEYLDSEKYEIRVRDFSVPGNIVSEITKLNRIRKSHPALQSHLGLRFYPADNDQVLFYGKALPLKRGDGLILIAVSLDPFHVQETTIEIPLWEWKLPDNGVVAVRDLMRGHAFSWQGKRQTVRLDPADLPFAIWRIAPGAGA